MGGDGEERTNRAPLGECLELGADVIRRPTMEEVRVAEFLDPRVDEGPSEEASEDTHRPSLPTP